MSRPCKTCGDPMEGDAPQQKYCHGCGIKRARECQRQYKLNHPVGRSVVRLDGKKPCEDCGGALETPSPQRRFCNSCATARKREATRHHMRVKRGQDHLIGRPPRGRKFDAELSEMIKDFAEERMINTKEAMEYVIRQGFAAINKKKHADLHATEAQYIQANR